MESQIDLDEFALSIKRPGRYANNELNAVHKKVAPELANFVLAFPDLYEIGMSHLGLKILYKILNDGKNSAADRVYAPDIDLINYLRESKTPLFSIENRLPLLSYDVLGFTLQYELSYTNILMMLDLSNIPVFSKERDSSHPLVLAGGPGAFNPQPLSPFIDGFVIGDAEEIITDVAATVNEYKSAPREEQLKNLAQLKGVYIPEFYSETTDSKGTYVKSGRDFAPEIIQKNIFSDINNLDKSAHPQLVPITDIVHNRATVEIMRGCTRGCRFCQAGMIYRPTRERDEKLVLQTIQTEVEVNGWDEISLVSLSSSDYSCVTNLINTLTNLLKQTSTNLSFPSLRIDSFENNISNLTKNIMGKTLTLAPEAGSQKLRDIINKNISNEEIFSSIKKAAKLGIRNLKLYFMVGLPYETDDDMQKLVELIEDIKGITSGKNLRINVKLAPFIPKPFTPFQWMEYEKETELKEKIYFIKDSLAHHKNIRIKYHDTRTSFIEAVIARGDSNIADLLYSAYKNGAVLASWNEHFDYSIWKKSAAESHINLHEYAKTRDVSKKLPWDHIDIGVKKEFLVEELEKAKKHLLTDDCRTSKCTECGVCDLSTPKFANRGNTDSSANVKEELPSQEKNKHPQIYKYRIYYKKKSELKFSSHRDLMKFIYQLARKSELPIYYTKGFNMRPKISFCSPLALGLIGHNEFFDLRLLKQLNKTEIISKLNKNNHPGFKIKKVEGPPKILPKIGSFKNEVIKISSRKHGNLNKLLSGHDQKDYFYGNKDKKIFINDVINKIEIKKKMVLINKKIIGAGILDILENFYGLELKELGTLNIERLNLIN